MLAYFFVVLTIIPLSTTDGLPSKKTIVWGQDGHRIVCDIAYRNLTTKARESVDELLASDPDERWRDFREACIWADDVRGSVAAYDTFRTAHYVNLQRRSEGLDLARDCGRTFCVVEAIIEQRAILADDTASEDLRRDALKFLGHFVGDLHQPLHVGYAEDRGGNSVSVIANGASNSLHGYWDSGMIDRKGLEWEAYSRSLRFGINNVDRNQWASLDPVEWANESFQIVEGQVYVFPLDGGIPDEYYHRNIQTLESQLRKGGIRLAALLNEVLG